MTKFQRGLFGTVGLVALAVSLTAMADSMNVTQIATSGEKVDGAPFTVKRDWGTFTLSAKIADKVKKKEKINYVFSYQGSGIPLFSPQYAQGFKQGCEMGNAVYPMDCASIAPVQTNVNEQVSQIETKLAAGAIDCLSIEPTSTDGLTAITNKIMDQGIPVFTAGVTSKGHEFSNFTQIPIKEGGDAAAAVLAWMKDTGTSLKVFAVSGGDPAEFWAQGRMKGFHEAIMKAVPDAKFVNTEKDGLNTSYEPGKTYDNFKAFFSAHPDVQFMENVDIGAEHADRAITDLNLKGKVFTIGWNVSKGQLDGIDAGIQVAALDQRWAEQAAFGGPACATFFAKGEILPNTQTLNPVTKANTAQARADLDKVMKAN